MRNKLKQNTFISLQMLRDLDLDDLEIVIITCGIFELINSVNTAWVSMLKIKIYANFYRQSTSLNFTVFRELDIYYTYIYNSIEV